MTAVKRSKVVHATGCFIYLFIYFLNIIQVALGVDAGFSAEPVLPAFCWLAFDFASFDENLDAFCRLECFAGFTFLPADGHSASLKLTQKGQIFSFPSYFLLNRATEILQSPQSAPLEPHGKPRCCFGTRVSVERETTTKAVSIRVKSRASDTECPEALPVSVLHALTISQLVDEWLARTASIVDSSEVRERPSVCRS